MRNLSTKFVIVLMLGLFTWACQDDTVDVRQEDQAVASDEAVQSKTQANAKKENKLLKKVKVIGELSDGGAFDGKVTITEFSYDEARGLLVSGEIEGKATSINGKSMHVKQAFSNVATTLVSGGGSEGARLAATQATCDILFLDLGPLSLDLLGLTVDLSEVVLDINAVSGSGNLLGNLLCAVAGLLDPAGFLTDLIGSLSNLLDLLNQINNLLG